jgi:hypothetical protein
MLQAEKVSGEIEKGKKIVNEPVDENTVYM